MKNYKYRYLEGFIPIKFNKERVYDCIGEIVREFNEISKEIGLNKDITYNNSKIYFIDCDIKYEVYDDLIKFNKWENLKIDKSSSIEITVNKYYITIFYDGNIKSENVDFNKFNLYDVIDRVIKYLLSV